VSSQYILFQAVFGASFVELSKERQLFQLSRIVQSGAAQGLSFILLPVFVLISFIISMFWGWAALALWGLYMLTMAMALPAGLITGISGRPCS